ncbi:MAG: DNA-processing protein DprA [Clostridia bacterium]|nr:DNA-processing protein DprA [Clostridia bacterium]
MDERLLWLWLSLRLPAGSKVGPKLLSHFGGVEAVYESERKRFLACEFLNHRHINALSDKDMFEAESILAFCEKYKVTLITMGSELYPKTLETLENPPLVLYALGKIPNFNSDLFIAVVGTRSMSDYGRVISYGMGYNLAAGGACVVSGLARGIDSTAQTGCLDAGGTTVAVLGCGINVVYPKENRPLMKRIVDSGGLILTEYPPNTPPHGGNFPVRNRLICGLCQGTVVVEADRKSGALITARQAIMQGRDLYAVPGRINAHGSSGTNELIKEGAQIARSALDVLENYWFLYPHCTNLSAAKLAPPSPDRILTVACHPEEGFDWGAYSESTPPEMPEPERKKPAPARTKKTVEKKVSEPQLESEEEEPSVSEITPSFDTSRLSPAEQKVYSAMIPNKPMGLDDLAKCGLSSKVITGALTLLEIYGAIEASPGGFYIRKQ